MLKIYLRLISQSTILNKNIELFLVFNGNVKVIINFKIPDIEKQYMRN